MAITKIAQKTSIGVTVVSQKATGTLISQKAVGITVTQRPDGSAGRTQVIGH